MPPHRLTMLRRFFQDYKQLEGKAVEVDEIQPAKEAFPIIEDALGRYSRQRRQGVQVSAAVGSRQKAECGMRSADTLWGRADSALLMVRGLVLTH